ncbi:hypothetical protein PHBOTO_002800 [Pseudozyma hubeiensis]|nr:hypothetical protein PHBOTO_002800 [Pseudozyma hubeiensis]
MKSHMLILHFSILLLLPPLLTTCAPTLFRNPLHVFQQFSLLLYPLDPKQQARSILTLKYLFRSTQWVPSSHWSRIDDFLQTGGLQSGYHTRDQVLLQDAIAHLQVGTIYQDPSVLKPSMDGLIQRNFSKAKKEFGFDKERLLRTPPNLGRGGGSKGMAVDWFEGVPRPMTLQEAEALVGDAWKKGARDGTGEGAEQKRVKGFDSIFASE